MAEKITVPTLGESVTEATVSKWLKSQGEEVTADEPLVELETDKVNIEVPSPTYTLVQTYDMENFELWHCDMYRLETPSDAYELGLFDAFEDAVCVIEWPEKLGSLLPKKIYKIDLKFNNEGRTAYLDGFKKDI